MTESGKRESREGGRGLQEVMRQLRKSLNANHRTELESLIARYDAEIEKLEFRYTKGERQVDQKSRTNSES